VPVLPWLLDTTPLPPRISQRQGIQGTDPAPVVDAVSDVRRRHRRRFSAVLAATATLLAPGLWFAPRLLMQESLTFRGHVVDAQNNKPVADADVEAGGVSGKTGANGEFHLLVPGPPGGVRSA
jgi:hypothetical protein